MTALIQRIDGLIIALIMEEDRSVPSFIQTGVPVVLVDRDVTTTNCDRVLVDNLSGIEQAIDHLVSLGHTDIADNLVSFGALKALNELSVQIPAAISIIGFDDLSFANLLKPPLTVISGDDKDQGAQAARLFFDRISGGRTSAGRVPTLPVNLVVRPSTSTPREKKRS